MVYSDPEFVSVNKRVKDPESRICGCQQEVSGSRICGCQKEASGSRVCQQEGGDTGLAATR